MRWRHCLVYYSVSILEFLREVFFPRQCKQKLGSHCCPGYEEAEAEIRSSVAVMSLYWLPYFCFYYLIFCYEVFQFICGHKSQIFLNSTNIYWLFVAGLCSRCCGYGGRLACRLVIRKHIILCPYMWIIWPQRKLSSYIVVPFCLLVFYFTML